MSTSRIPASRPIVKDVAVQVERPDRARVVGALAEALAYAYATDLRYGPGDYQNFCVDKTPHNNTGNIYARNWVALPIAGSYQSTCDLGRIYVPPANHPAARNLIVWVYCRIQGTADQADLYFQSDTYGQLLAPQRISYATLGNQTSGWLSYTLPAKASDAIDVTMKYVAGGAEKTTVKGICAHWEPTDGIVAGLTIETNWEYWISQTLEQDGQPHDSYVLTWLQRKIQQLAAHRPRQVFAKWFDAWYDSGVSAPRDTTVGRYKVYIGEFATGFYVDALVNAVGPGTFNYKVYVNGVLQQTFAASYPSWSYAGGMVSTGFTTDAVNEIRIDTSIGGSPSSSALFVASLTITEGKPTAAQLGLPSGDAIPATFPSVDSRLLTARSNIYADLDEKFRRAGLKHLVAGVPYLAANRTRALINDCRYGTTTGGDLNYGTSQMTGSANLNADATIQAVYRVQVGPDTKTMRVWAAATWNQWDANVGVPIDYANTQIKAVPAVGSIIAGSPALAGAPSPWVHIGDLDVSASSGSALTINVGVKLAGTSNVGHAKLNGVVLEELALTEGDMTSL